MNKIFSFFNQYKTVNWSIFALVSKIAWPVIWLYTLFMIKFFYFSPDLILCDVRATRLWMTRCWEKKLNVNLITLYTLRLGVILFCEIKAIHDERVKETIDAEYLKSDKQFCLLPQWLIESNMNAYKCTWFGMHSYLFLSLIVNSSFIIWCWSLLDTIDW